MERNREQALLAADVDPIAEVEERLPLEPAANRDADAAVLLDDVELPGLRAGRGEVRDLARRDERAERVGALGAFRRSGPCCHESQARDGDERFHAANGRRVMVLS